MTDLTTKGRRMAKRKVAKVRLRSLSSMARELIAGAGTFSDVRAALAEAYQLGIEVASGMHRVADRKPPQKGKGRK